MARFLIGTVPVVGHVTPALAIARRLVERRHDVWWYTGKAFRSYVEATGARFVPMVQALDYSDLQNVPPAWMTQRSRLRGLAQLKFDLKHFFIDAAIGQVKDYAALLQEFPADVLLADSFFLGASWVHEQGGPPWAQFGISALGIRSRDTAPFGLGLPPNASWLGQLRNRSLHGIFQTIVFRDLVNNLNMARRQVGLAPRSQTFFDVLSPFLYLAGTVPAFEYPRSNLPPQVHFVGPFLPDPPPEFTPPDWWSDMQCGQPVIHVTQGTIATEPTDLIVPTLKALAEEPVLVVAATGGKPVETVNLDPWPVNARVAAYLPYAHLLPHVDVMITNGGYNGVQLALAHGIPLIAAGKTEDKPEVCARIAWSGVGMNLNTKTPTPAQIKAAVHTLLTEPHYRAKAQALRTEIQQSDAPVRAAELLEHLAVTQEPVLRDR